jgi:hypothetical protein
MKRPKLEYYGKPKVTDKGVETNVPISDVMRFVKELEAYCDRLEQVNSDALADVVLSEERTELNPDKELLDCIHNLMGYFDTPIARLKMQGEDCEAVRKIGREVLSKHNRDWRGGG